MVPLSVVKETVGLSLISVTVIVRKPLPVMSVCVSAYEVKVQVRVVPLPAGALQVATPVPSGAAIVNEVPLNTSRELGIVTEKASPE